MKHWTRILALLLAMLFSLTSFSAVSASEVVEEEKNGEEYAIDNESSVDDSTDETERFEENSIELASEPEIIDSGTCGENLSWSLDDNGTLTISGSGPMTDYSSEERAPWFVWGTYIHYVVIPDGLTEIGDYAFYGLDHLTYIVIPNSVTDIGNHAFMYCSNLSEVVLSNVITIIGDYSFCDCASLTSIEIPNGVTTIGEWAFYNCKSLSDVQMPDSVVSIGVYAFANCTSLKSIYLPENLMDISESLLNGCTSLISLVIPDSVTSIGDYAFLDCTNLATINIPNGVSSFGYWAFARCSSLTNIVIPDSVTSIESGAFEGCSSLSSIELPSNLTSIGNNAFSDCVSLSNIRLPNSVNNIETAAFSGCTSLSSIEIPENVTYLYENTFKDCTSLRSVVIPNRVEEFYGSPFSGCSISQLVISGNGGMQLGNVGYETWKGMSSDLRVIISSGITSIGVEAFCHCSIASLEIPESVTSIWDYAFRYASLSDVYYSGYAEEWETIAIGRYGNDALKEATIHYGKTFGSPVYEWQKNEEGFAVIATAVCEQDPEIVVTETVKAKSLIIINSTCLEEGKVRYTASFSNKRFETQLKTLPIPARAHTLVYMPNKSATVDETGNTECWCCKTCHKYFSDEAAQNEISDQEAIIPKLINIQLAEVAEIADSLYKAEPLTPVPVVIFNGEVLIEGTDYTISYRNNTNAGTAKILITGNGIYGGEKTVTFSIKPISVSPSVTLSAASYTYDGSAKKPTVTVKVGSTKLTKASYSVTYKNNTSVGKASVVIKLKGNYSGSKTVTFKINPKGTTLATSTAASKAITVKWKKQSTKMAKDRITGYQIQLATNSKFTKNKKTVTVSGYSKTSKKVTGLKGKKKYYIRIRTYKTVSGTKYYSPWSKVKTVTTKA